MSLRNLLKSAGHNYSTVARALGLSPQAVAGWDKNGVPAERVLALVELTGICANQLRPDIYPLDKKAV